MVAAHLTLTDKELEWGLLSIKAKVSITVFGNEFPEPENPL